MPNVKKIILLGAPSEFTDVLQRYSDMLGYNERIRNQIKLTIINTFGKAPEDFSTARFLKDISSEGLIIHDSEDKESTIETTKENKERIFKEYLKKFVSNFSFLAGFGCFVLD